MDKPMDETDRKHCLLDLHGIRESLCPEQRSVDFIKKWGDGLQTVLAEESESERIDPLEHRDLEIDLTRQEHRSATLERAIEDAIKALDDITVFDANGRDKIDAVVIAMEGHL